MELSDCKNCVHGSSCFKKLVSNELDFIAEKKTQIVYHKGETLCKKGAIASTIYYIIDGLVKVYLDGPSRKNLAVSIMKNGDFIGLTTLFDTPAYYYTSSALTETTVCSIDKKAVSELLYQNCHFGTEIIKFYCKNYGRLFDKIASYGFKQVNGRVADVLLEIDEIEYNDKSIHYYLTRKDLADMAGIPSGSLLRVLSEFSDAGIIDLSRKSIILKDKSMLAKISKSG